MREINIQELEKLIAHHKYNECEVIAEIGRDRFEKLSANIRTEIQKAGLNEWQAHNFLNHLSDTFRLERIRV